jgi:hypothetical protein
VPRTSNKTTKVAKKMKESEQRCMVDDISKCYCKRLQGDFTALRSTFQERHEEINTDPKSFCRYVDLKKRRVGYLS